MACNGKRERSSERCSSDDESFYEPISIECPYCSSIFELSDDLEPDQQPGCRESRGEEDESDSKREGSPGVASI